ncbi:hypothetical protein DICVIV_06121 [Dictyocaulus viviparus]|uniref:Uncharacterized protein n=1 Tax=Dictyocaulus viviparus TaxID=29172 RepID=A0A0D8XT32_DICVI|nr:hypothetical protein DICVIV_06121 [Dictyocaulus viviparus]
MEEYRHCCQMQTFSTNKQRHSKQCTPLLEADSMEDINIPRTIHNTIPNGYSSLCNEIPRNSYEYRSYDEEMNQSSDFEYSQHSYEMCLTRSGVNKYEVEVDEEFSGTCREPINKSDEAAFSETHFQSLNDNISQLIDRGTIEIYRRVLRDFFSFDHINIQFYSNDSGTSFKPYCARTKTEEYENGAVVAVVLGLGVCCVTLCCFWNLIQVFLLILIPAFCFYQINFPLCNSISASLPIPSNDNNDIERNILEADCNRLTKYMDITAVTDNEKALWSRMMTLEDQNKQLICELEKQRQATEQLLSQLDDSTSKSYNAESNSERVISRDDIFEDEFKNLIY